MFEGHCSRKRVQWLTSLFFALGSCSNDQSCVFFPKISNLPSKKQLSRAFSRYAYNGKKIKWHVYVLIPSLKRRQNLQYKSSEQFFDKMTSQRSRPCLRVTVHGNGCNG